MNQIRITRDPNGNVKFQTVSIDVTENVFFTNLNPPPATVNQTPPYAVTYKCQIPGHQNEQGVINVFAVLAAGTTTLAAATKGTPITKQQVVVGGQSPYTVSNAQFQIKDSNNNVIQSGAGIGPGLQ